MLSILLCQWSAPRRVGESEEEDNVAVDEYQNLVQVFKMFDKDHDGTITLSDLHVLSHLGEAIPEEEIDSLIRAMGYGNVIPYEDLAHALLRTD